MDNTFYALGNFEVTEEVCRLLEQSRHERERVVHAALGSSSLLRHQVVLDACRIVVKLGMCNNPQRFDNLNDAQFEAEAARYMLTNTVFRHTVHTIAMLVHEYADAALRMR